MGPCFSSSSTAKSPKIQNISSPQETLVTVPRSTVDERGNPIRVEDNELDRQTLDAVFSLMGQYIAQQHRIVTAIAIGGAVNVMLLQNHQSTQHVEYFGTNMGNEERLILGNAARYAEQNSPNTLGTKWFNNQTMLQLPPSIHATLTQESIKQDEVVFNREGLKILAAPWNYALCSKMDRLVTHRRIRSHDLSDAVAYLHYYIQGHGRISVSTARVKGWCQSYQMRTSDDVIKAVNKEYRRLHGKDGIRR
ncbi:MAG: hypothetical protein Q9164_002212 [Protoblastenia rupestris]